MRIRLRTMHTRRAQMIGLAIPILCATPLAAPPQAQAATIVFADEFTGLSGSAPNPAHWSYDVGKGISGNSTSRNTSS
ncbi:hypothetical protein [Smaragdicoccus niigatensis]|uniref:hypothetical protein n=1 Tax=Smaragdicoccus niigatensis TaxID=359359 RepID=UPI0003635A99|nr:hypothetical protein [Smaragdicoccus niigatensis]